MDIEANDRDLAALLFTWQNRFVSGAQLKRGFWQDVEPKSANRRLALLRKQGLLNYHTFPWLPEHGLYFSCREGNKVLASCGLLSEVQARDYPRRPEELSPALRHDLNVVDLRLGLEESGVDGRTWISDHQLRMQQRKMGAQQRVPDAVFEYTHKNVHGLGVLEYERAPYRKALVHGLLTRLRDRYEDHTLFIVTPNPDRSETFRNWVADSGVYNDAPRQTAFSHQEAVVKDGLDGGFVDLNGKAWGGNRGT